MYPNYGATYSAATRAELRKSIIQTKNQNAPTHASLKEGAGARSEQKASIAGLEIPFKNGVPHGTTALDPTAATPITSFEPFIPPPVDKMYVGLAFMGFTVEWEHFHEIDAGRGNLPETRFDSRDAVMLTYYQEQNWYACGVKTGSLAVVAAGGGGGSGTITFAADNTARGRSKGSVRLAVSNSTAVGQRIKYQSYTEATDTLTATFYITAKASATTATVVITDAGTIVAGDVIVKYGHYKRVPYGLGYYFNHTGRQVQGASSTTHPWLNAKRVNAGGAAITPTMLDTAKTARQMRMNDGKAGRNSVAHMTPAHYKTLASYGYTLRHYNAEKGDANTTFGMPNNFEDEDLEFVLDADMEDALIYIRNKKSFFYYRQSELREVSHGPTQYVGTNLVGSTENYQNWGEAFNLAYDWRGEDGKGKNNNGGPFDGIVIDTLELPASTQVTEGLSLV